MKPINLIPVVILFAASVSFAALSDPWLRQSTPTLAELHKVIFADTLYGWSAGDSGVIIHTTNGGQNWVRQNSGINYSIEDLFFLNRRLGWAIANDFFYLGTTILRTTDGGSSWQFSRYPDTSIVLRCIYFVDSLNGWQGGDFRYLLQTTNGGANWVMRQYDSSTCFLIPTRGFKFFSPQYGFAFGGHFDVEGFTVRTVNDGITWGPDCSGGEPVYDLVFLDSNNIIGSGGDFEYGASIVRSTDGGVSWNYVFLNLFGAGIAMAFRTRSEGWMSLGFAEKWAVTRDSGMSWYEFDDSVKANDVVFTDSLHGWACGSGGGIWKYNTAVIGIQNQNENYPRADILFQNYPNPFNPETVIRYSLTVNSFVILNVYNTLGQEVYRLVNEIQKAGSYEVEWDAANYPSGIYFYKLTTPSHSETKKLVILK